MKKKVWLVNRYAMPPQFESRLRTIKFAHYLSQMGYEVTIFGASFMHNMNIDLIDNNESFIKKKYGDLNFVHIKTIGYKGNGFLRFINLFQFHVKLYLNHKKFDSPDIIVHTALPPFGNILFYLARKLKAKYIVEVLDLWPESFVDLGLISKRNPILKWLYKSEKWLYKNADKVVFSIEGGKNYIVDKKWDLENGGSIDLKKVFYINNGVDLNDYENFKLNHKFEDVDLDNESTKKVIYLGSIRLANNLKELINAAEILKDDDTIRFLLYGDGEDRKLLEDYCKSKELKNIIFKQKWVDPQYVPYILSKSSLNILNYKSGDFGKYGGSQSKLFQYMASGTPICSNIKMMHCLINKYNLGIAKEFNTAEEYAESILSLLNIDDSSRLIMSRKMKEVAREFDYPVLTKKMARLF